MGAQERYLLLDILLLAWSGTCDRFTKCCHAGVSGCLFGRWAKADNGFLFPRMGRLFSGAGSWAVLFSAIIYQGVSCLFHIFTSLPANVGIIRKECASATRRGLLSGTVGPAGKQFVLTTTQYPDSCCVSVTSGKFEACFFCPCSI